MCIRDRLFSIDEPKAITYTLQSETNDCDNFNKSILINDLQGGTLDAGSFYTFQWSGPSRVNVDNDGAQTGSQGSAYGLTKGGVYTVTVADQNGCENTQEFTLVDDFSVTASITHVSCAGDNSDATKPFPEQSSNDGSITLSVTGAASAPSFDWYQLIELTQVGTSAFPAYALSLIHI